MRKLILLFAMSASGCHKRRPAADWMSPDALLSSLAELAPAEGARLVPQVGHRAAPARYAVDPTGRYAVSVGEDGRGIIWHLGAGAVVRHLAGPRSAALALAWGPGGVVLLDANGRLMRFDPLTGLGVDLGEGGCDLALSPDGQRVLLAQESGAVLLAELGAKGRHVVGRAGRACPSVRWIDAEQYAIDGDAPVGVGPIVAAEDGTAVFQPAQDAVLPVSLAGEVRPAASVSVSGTALLVAGAGGLQRWDLAGGRIRSDGEAAEGAPAALSPDGRWLASVGLDGALVVRDRRGDVRTRLMLPGPLHAVAVSDDGTVAVGLEDGRALTAALGDEAPAIWRVGRGPVSVDLAADGARALLASHDGRVQLIAPALAAPLAAGRVRGGAFSAAVLGVDGRSGVVVGAADGVAGGMWRMAEGADWAQQVATLPRWALAAATDPVSSALIVSTFDGETCTVGAEPARCFPHEGDLITALEVVGRAEDPLLIGGGASGFIYVWDLERGELRARLVSAESGGALRWAVTTPDGHFDAPAGGEASLLYRVQPGPEGPEPFALSQYRDRGWWPGLLSDALAGRPPDPIDPTLPVPPTLHLLSPPMADHPFVRVCAIDAGGGLGPVQVYVNGRAVTPPSGSAGEDGCEELDLPVGAVGRTYTEDLHGAPTLHDPPAGDRIEVTAATADGRVTGPPLVLSLGGARGGVVLEDDYDGGEAPAALGALRAVVIGVADYAGTLALAYPDDDAEAVARALEIGGRAPFVGAPVVTRLPTEEQSATREAILGAIDAAAQAAGPDDVLVIYLAGHGRTWQGDWVFLAEDAPSDALDTLGRLSTHIVSSSELAERLRLSRARRILLIMDACASGEAASAFAGAEVDRVAARSVQAVEDRAAIYVLAASSGDLAAYEHPRLGHGLLTWSLLDALSAPDGLPDGWWDADVVFSLVRSRVPALAARLGLAADQEPMVARPRLDSALRFGAWDAALAGALALPRLGVRVGTPGLLDAEDLVDHAGLSASLAGALRARGVAGVEVGDDGPAVRVGGLYARSSGGLCAQLSLFEGDRAAGRRVFRGEGAELVAEMADWIVGCATGEACDGDAAEGCP